MTRRGLRTALVLPAIALLAAVVLLPAASSAAADEPDGNEARPANPTSFRSTAATVPFRIPGSQTTAASAAAACDGTSGVACSTVVVPLDRSGRVPGTVALHVESLPAEGPEHGVMMLVAGGPGQGSPP